MEHFIILTATAFIFQMMLAQVIILASTQQEEVFPLNDWKDAARITVLFYVLYKLISK